MRLTLINQFYKPDLSPTAHLCASLAEHRAALGDDVTVVTGRGGYVKPIGGGRDAGVRVIRLWTAQLGSRSLLRRAIDWMSFYLLALARAVTLPRQDVVVCLTTPPYIALAGIAHKLLHPGARLVLWNMDCYPEAVERTGIIKAGGLLARAMRFINRRLFRRLDALVCLDGAMKELLSKYAPPALPCRVIPNWERAEFFPADGDVPPWDHPAVRALQGRLVVLYLGNAGYGHEFATLIDVAERLRDKPVTFLFVGGGALRPWIAAEAHRRGLASIVLLDYVAKELTPAVMGTAGCALITLENYAAGVMSPSKLHSNLAMGLPVVYVGPPRTNVDEAIERFSCGGSFRPGDVGGVTEFLESLATSPELRSELRARARRAFEEAYCDLRTLPQFDELLAVLAPLPGPRAPGAIRAAV